MTKIKSQTLFFHLFPPLAALSWKHAAIGAAVGVFLIGLTGVFVVLFRYVGSYALGIGDTGGRLVHRLLESLWSSRSIFIIRKDFYLKY